MAYLKKDDDDTQGFFPGLTVGTDPSVLGTPTSPGLAANPSSFIDPNLIIQANQGADPSFLTNGLTASANSAANALQSYYNQFTNSLPSSPTWDSNSQAIFDNAISSGNLDAARSMLNSTYNNTSTYDTSAIDNQLQTLQNQISGLQNPTGLQSTIMNLNPGETPGEAAMDAQIYGNNPALNSLAQQLQNSYNTTAANEATDQTNANSAITAGQTAATNFNNSANSYLSDQLGNVNSSIDSQYANDQSTAAQIAAAANQYNTVAGGSALTRDSAATQDQVNKYNNLNSLMGLTGSMGYTGYTAPTVTTTTNPQWWQSGTEAGDIAARPDVQKAISAGTISADDWWNKFGQTEDKSAEQSYANSQLNANSLNTTGQSYNGSSPPPPPPPASPPPPPASTNTESTNNPSTTSTSTPDNSQWWSGENEQSDIAARPDVQAAISNGTISADDWWNKFGQNEQSQAEQKYAQGLAYGGMFGTLDTYHNALNDNNSTSTDPIYAAPSTPPPSSDNDNKPNGFSAWDSPVAKMATGGQFSTPSFGSGSPFGSMGILPDTSPLALARARAGLDPTTGQPASNVPVAGTTDGTASLRSQLGMDNGGQASSTPGAMPGVGLGSTPQGSTMGANPSNPSGNFGGMFGGFGTTSAGIAGGKIGNMIGGLVGAPMGIGSTVGNAFGTLSDYETEANMDKANGISTPGFSGFIEAMANNALNGLGLGSLASRLGINGFTDQDAGHVGQMQIDNGTINSGNIPDVGGSVPGGRIDNQGPASIDNAGHQFEASHGPVDTGPIDGPGAPGSSSNGDTHEGQGNHGGDSEDSGYSIGGKVKGPGGPRDDAVNAHLSNGEFVVQQPTAALLGSDFLNIMNNISNQPANVQTNVKNSLMKALADARRTA